MILERLVRFGPWITLVWMTILEYVRQKWLMLAWIVGIIWIFLSTLLSSMSLDEYFRVLLHLGLLSAQLLSVFTGLILGSSWFHKELEFQTIYVVLSRPLERSLYLSAKFFGFLLLLGVILMSLWVVHVIMLIKYDFSWFRLMYVYLTFLFEGMVVYLMAQLAGLWVKPVLAFSCGLMGWIAGWWLADLIYFAKKADSLFYKVASWVLPYFFPSFYEWTDLRSVYFVTGKNSGGWGLGFFLIASIYSLMLGFMSAYFFQRKDLSL